MSDETFLCIRERLAEAGRGAPAAFGDPSAAFLAGLTHMRRPSYGSRAGQGGRRPPGGRPDGRPRGAR